MTKHLRGICDVGDCESLASWAFRDEEANIYLEVCPEHAEKLRDRYDSDYRQVERDSPERGEPERRLDHDCGGTLKIHETTEGEHRFCDTCGYTLLWEDTGEDTMEVRFSDGKT